MRFWITLAILALSVGDAVAQQGPPEHLRRRGRAVEDMVASRGDDGLQRFAQEHLAPAYRESFAPGKLMEHLAAIRAACAGNEAVLYRPGGDNGLLILFSRVGKQTPVLMKVEPAEPRLIVALELQPERGAEPTRVSVEPITWENLEKRLDEEAASGFAGTVLVVRGGKTVLHRGYGLANREKGIANGTETIFAIGSTPIDFTHAAVLKLEEMGKLKTSDPITTFMKDVPADKQAITLDHLMSGGSGLPDFHHIEGVDKDYDLSWIERDEAVRRILGQHLLFAPGTGDEHSHSAWVLLAAIVEMASGQSYGDFLRKQFFEPAGMTRTGLHEDALAFPDDAFAVGYEGRPVGELNIPKYWGRTSWLVMGSGGMQSNPGDLNRWMQAIRSGKTLGAAAAKKYWRNAISLGGDDRGFMCLLNENEGDYMILCSNVHSGMGDRPAGVGRRLLEMVTGRELQAR